MANLKFEQKSLNFVAERNDDSVFFRRINRQYIPEVGQLELIQELVQRNSIRAVKIYKGETVGNPLRVLFLSSYGVIDEGRAAPLVPSYGLWQLADYVFENNKYVDPIVIDPNLLYSLDSLERILKQREFDLIGFSTMPANLENDLRVIAMVRKIQQSTRTLIGGIRSDALADSRILEATGINHLVIGPGEESVIKIINAITNGQEASLPRVMLSEKKGGNNGNYHNSIPFGESDLFHEKHYDSEAPYIALSNQCKLSCFWCSSPKNGPFFANPKVVVDQLSQIVSNEVDPIVFNDNDITYNRDFVINLCELIKSRKIVNPKHCKATICGVDDEIIDSLAAAGFVRISFGIESFHPRVRNFLGKNFQDDKITRVLEKTLASGMQPEINLILFSPAEDEDTLRCSVTEAASWMRKGIMIFSNFGLHALFGHIKHSVPIDNRDVFYEGMTDRMEIPFIYSPSPEMKSLYLRSLEKFRLSCKGEFEHINSNAIKSALKLRGIAEILNMAEQYKIFDEYINNQKGTIYVNV